MTQPEIPRALQAAVDAVALSHGVARQDVLMSRQAAYHRRLAAYVAHTAFGIEADVLARAFGRSEIWAYDILAEMAGEAVDHAIVARDVADARERALAILEAGPAPAEARPLLDDAQAAEARRLRAKGWSIKGLARRYALDPAALAFVIGEPLRTEDAP